MYDETYLEPLSNDEIIKYFKEYRNGNREAGDIIAMHNFKLVNYVVNTHFELDLINKDDLYSVGRIGLVKAINTYDLDKNVNFSTYATKCIKIELMNYYRRRKPITISIEDLLFKDESVEESSIFTIEDNFTSNFINKEYVQYLLNTLTNEERDIIEMHFGFGSYNKPIGQIEIAKKYNVSRQSMSKKINNILEDLKHCSENEEYAKIRKLRKNNS